MTNVPNATFQYSIIPFFRSSQLPRSLIHAGEAGLEGIDASDLPVQSGEQLPVVGVEFLQERKVVGMHALTAGHHFGAELCPRD